MRQSVLILTVRKVLSRAFLLLGCLGNVDAKIQEQIFPRSLLKRYPHLSTYVKPGSVIRRQRSWTNRIFAITPPNHVAPQYIIRLRQQNKQQPFHISSVCELKHLQQLKESGIDASNVIDSFPPNVMVFRYILESRPLNNDDFNAEKTLKDALSILKKLHHAPFRFAKDKSPFDEIRGALQILNNRLSGIEKKRIEYMYDILSRIERIYKKNKLPNCPCHGDPAPSNFLTTPTKMTLIDWESSGNFDPGWDLAMLANITHLDEERFDRLINLYNSPHDITLKIRAEILRAIVSLWHSCWFYTQAKLGNTAMTKETATNLGKESFIKFYQLTQTQRFQDLLRKIENTTHHDVS